MYPQIKLIIGQRFERLTVIENKPFSNYKGHLVWKCQCDCGKLTSARAGQLRRGDKRSCGCLHKEFASNLGKRKMNVTHGMSYSSEYGSWVAMNRRCKPDSRQRKDYFDRGITVHPEWVGKGGFNRFIAYVGIKPFPNFSVDRINNDKGYEPGNIRWASSKTQQNNTRRKKIEEFSDEQIILEVKRRQIKI